MPAADWAHLNHLNPAAFGYRIPGSARPVGPLLHVSAKGTGSSVMLAVAAIIVAAVIIPAGTPKNRRHTARMWALSSNLAAR